MAQLESVMECYKIINNIFREDFGVEDPSCVYLCTNYVDRRLGYLLIYQQEHKKEIKESNRKQLASSLENFLNNLDENETYILPKSGTYSLTVPLSTLRQVIDIYSE